MKNAIINIYQTVETVETSPQSPQLQLFLFLVCNLLLVACGSSGNNSNTAVITTTVTTVQTNTIDVKTTVLDWITGSPITGATVLLNPGNIIALTNAAGIANFIAVATGKHDLHIFKNGYVSESIYQATANNFTWRLRSNKKSYLNFSVQVQLGALVFGEKLELLMQESKQKQLVTSNQCSLVAGKYNCSLLLAGVDVGVPISMLLYTLKRDVNGDIIDAINNGISTWTTQASASSVGAQTIIISMNAIKPGRRDLALLNSATPPAGMNIANVTAHLLYLQGTKLSSGKGTPIVFNSFYDNTKVFLDNTIWLTAKTATGNWRKSIKHNPVGNMLAINLTASIATMPSIAAQNAGGVANYSLIFTPAGGSFATHIITLRDNTGADVWHFYSSNTTGTITLPTIPGGIIPTMQTGGQHQLIVQALAADNVGFDAFINTYMADPLLNQYINIELAQSAIVNFTP